jgi:hypothetical protein
MNEKTLIPSFVCQMQCFAMQIKSNHLIRKVIRTIF